MMAKEIVLIPAYNEAARIESVIAGVREVLPSADILVVDDGSGDQTANIAKNAGAHVVSLPWNLGYGAALQTGYKYAARKGYGCLVQIDGDGQHHPDSILTLLGPVRSGEADFVIGSRFQSQQPYRPSWPRKFGMVLFGRLVSFVIRQRLTDSTSGFQAFNAEVIEYLTGDLFPCDYPDADLLVILHRAGFRLKERPVVMFPNPHGKTMHSGLKPLYYVFKMFLSIAVTLLRERRVSKGNP